MRRKIKERKKKEKQKRRGVRKRKRYRIMKILSEREREWAREGEIERGIKNDTYIKYVYTCTSKGI